VKNSFNIWEGKRRGSGGGGRKCMNIGICKIYTPHHHHLPSLILQLENKKGLEKTK
jgi:hypothetical protein